MTRRMLINAQRPEEVRVAIVSGERLDNYQVAVAEAGLARGNIYRGVVANLHASLNAAFVDFGAEKDGLLAAHDVVPQAYHRSVAVGESHPRIEKVLERGRPLLVQVTRDAAGSKGAALTTNLSIAGRYLVLMPFDQTRGISRKVEEEDTRAELRGQVERLDIPQGFGTIVRTNALGQTKATLQRDLAALMRVWKRIQGQAEQGKGPRLLYSDQDLVVQALRDYLDSGIAEVLVDDDEVFDKAKAYMRASMPRAKTNLLRYRERMPLFSRFDLEPQIEGIHRRTVPLPGGGSLVIDRTEALTAIDVNSGRAGHGASQEESSFQVNLEAAAEVARQLRLRDIGGLVVVDFIDMRSSKHQHAVEKGLREALKADKARTVVGRISPNGLLEINRQRIKQALALRTHRPCPTCAGAGSIPSPEFVSLSLLRRVEARAASGTLKSVRIALHPELADALQNARRQELAAFEREFDIHIEVAAMTSLHRSEERVEWFDREPEPPAAGPTPPVATAADLAPARRRAGKRGKPRAVPAPSVAAAEPAEEDEAAGAERRRKRRRGGRRHKKGRTAGTANTAPSPDQSVPEAAAAVPESVVAVAEAQGGTPEVAATVVKAAGASSSRRRRRHSRRRRGRDGAAEAPATEAGPPQES